MAAKPAWVRFSKNATPEAGDEAQTWSREQLERMNAKFARRLARAIRRGQERKPQMNGHGPRGVRVF
jgi:hypothetical protein